MYYTSKQKKANAAVITFEKSNKAEVAKESEGFHSGGKTRWKVARRAQQELGLVILPSFKVQICILSLGQMRECRSSGEVRRLCRMMVTMESFLIPVAVKRGSVEPGLFARGFSHGDRVREGVEEERRL